MCVCVCARVCVCVCECVCLQHHVCGRCVWQAGRQAAGWLGKWDSRFVHTYVEACAWVVVA